MITAGRKGELSLTVSVIVPAYNAAATIAAGIESLLAQSYPPSLVEIVIVDNNSRDDTAAIVGRYPVTLTSESIQTSYAARNRGIRESSGEIVAFMDSDCQAAPDWLKQLLPPFADPAIGAVGGAIKGQTPDPDNLVQRFFVAVEPFSDRAGEEILPALPTGNVAYRRSLIEQVGLFDETLFTAGDIDLGWRLQRQTGAQAAKVPGAIVYHQYRSTVRGLYKQYRRHGFGEVLLYTLHRQAGFYQPQPYRRMLRSGWSLLIYIRSMLYRPLVGKIKKVPDYPFYIAFPRLMFVAEWAGLVGKMKGWWQTRGFRRNPFPSRKEIVR